MQIGTSVERFETDWQAPARSSQRGNGSQQQGKGISPRWVGDSSF